MRNLLMFMMVSLDGYAEKPDGDIKWHRADDEFNIFVAPQATCAGEHQFKPVTRGTAKSGNFYASVNPLIQ